MSNEKSFVLQTRRFVALFLCIVLLVSGFQTTRPTKVFGEELVQDAENNVDLQETTTTDTALSENEENEVMEEETVSPQAFESIMPAAATSKIAVTAALTTNPTPMSGELFYLTYTLSAVANPDDPSEKIEGLNAEITIPKYLTVQDFISTNDYTVGNPPTTNGDGSKTYKITFKGTPSPGNNFGQINIPIKFNPGQNPVIIESNAENIFEPVLKITGTNFDDVIVDKINGSAPAQIKPQNDGEWKISKSKETPGIRYGDTYVDTPTKYQITLTSPNYNGVNLDIGAKVIEKIPPEAEYVKHTDPNTNWTSVYDPVAKTVTWTNTDATLVSSYASTINTYFYVWLKYPNPTVGAGTVTNNVELQAKYVRNGNTVGDTGNSIHKVITQPTPDGDFFEKIVNKTTVAVGEEVTFTLRQAYISGTGITKTVYTETGAVDGFKEITIVDDPLRDPTQDAFAGQSDFYNYFDFTKMSISGFTTKTYVERNNEQVTAEDINVAISYQTKKEPTWHTYSAITKASTSTKEITKDDFVRAGTLDADDNVTLIRVVYTYKDGNTSFPGDFAMPNINYSGVVTKNGPGSTAQNSAYFYVKYEDNTYNVNNSGFHSYEANYDSNKNFDTKTYTITEAKPYIYNYMYHGKDVGYIYQPGEVVKLTIRGSNYTTMATGPFVQPEEYILVPANYQITGATISSSYGFAVDTPIDTINDPDNTNLRVIRYTDGLDYKVIKISSPNGQVPIGSYYYIYVDVKVPTNAANYANFYRITMSMAHPYATDYMGTMQQSYTTSSDLYDLNQDGRTDTVAYVGSTKIDVLRELLFTSQKYVGTTQANYAQYVSVSQGSDFFYKIEMLNTSPYTAADKVRAIDILPAIGDTGVYAKTGTAHSRGSEWTPTNYALVSSSPGVTVYSTNILPTAEEIRKELQDVTSISTIPWTAGITADAKAIKIEKTTATPPNQKITLEFKARAKTMAPTDPPLLAWNSFAYGSDYNNGFNSGIHMPVAEPPKVGVYVTPTPPLKLSGVAWVDANKNGIREDSESIQSGWKVSLFDKANNYLGSTTTDASGAYEFLNLASSTEYIVKIEKPNNNTYTITTPNEGTNPAVDNDFLAPDTNDAVQYLGAKRVTMGTTDVTNVDAGMFTNGISGAVWYDENKNGLRDANEDLLSGITVELYDEKGLVVATKVTDAQGAYLFENVKDGQYTIKIKKTADNVYTLTPKNVDPDNKTIDSDFDKGTGTTFASVQVTMQGKDITNVDAGFVKNGISGILWYDYNRDGIRTDEEKRLSGITIELYDAQNNKVKETITDEKGAYVFSGVENQVYTLKIVETDGSHFVLTETKQGSDTGVDSDYTLVENYLGVVEVIVEGKDITDIDAGFVANRIQGVLWYDVNKDGIRDAEESLIPGMTVELYDEAGLKVGEMVTDDKGNYLFEGLGDQTYTLKMVPSDVFHYGMTKSGQGDDLTKNSDYEPTTETYVGAVSVTLYKEDVLHIDAGLITNDIQGVVWYDYNKDGLHDDFEPPIPGIIVHLYDENGVLIGTKITDEKGAYLFENVSNQTYEIRMESPTDPDFSLAKENQGNDPTIDSNFTKSPQYFGTTTVTVNGEDIRYIDAGLTTKKTALVIDVVDPNGKPVPNGKFEVKTIDENGKTITVGVVEVDEKGRLISEPLPPGKYWIVQTDTDENYLFNKETTYPFIVTGEEKGLLPQTVVNEPKNGIKIVVKDENNQPLKNMVVTVTASDGSTIEVTTNGNGEIYTDNLPPGEYTVRIKTPNGYTVKSNETKVRIPENNTQQVEVTYVLNTAKKEVVVQPGGGGGIYSVGTVQNNLTETPVKQESTPETLPNETTPPAPQVPTAPNPETQTPEAGEATPSNPENSRTEGLTPADRAAGYNAIDMNAGGEKRAVHYEEDGFKLEPNVHYYEEFSDDMVPQGYHKVEHIDEEGIPYWTIEPDEVALGFKENPKTGDNRANQMQKLQGMFVSSCVLLFVLVIERKRRMLEINDMNETNK